MSTLYSSGPSDKISNRDHNQLIELLQALLDGGQIQLKGPTPAPANAPTVSLAAGSLTGSYQWAVYWITGQIRPDGTPLVTGRTTLGPATTSQSLSSQQATVTLNNAPPSGVIGWGLARTKAGGGSFYVVAEIFAPFNAASTCGAGAIPSTYTDNTADSALTSAVPSTNTTGTWLTSGVKPSAISPQGAGSGLDADTVDGLHASAFASNYTHGSQTFTSSGNFTVPQGVYWILAELWGGGGGGGGGSGGASGSGYQATGGGGAGSGAHYVRRMRVNPGETLSIAVGAGGTGGSGGAGTGGTGGNGTAGGSSSVTGALDSVSVGGGVGGGGGQFVVYGTNSSGGYGGAINDARYGYQPLGTISNGGAGVTYNNLNGGNGGGAPFGGSGGAGGPGSTTSGAPGQAGTAPGGGGGGGGGGWNSDSSPGGPGGNGAPGQVILYW